MQKQIQAEQQTMSAIQQSKKQAISSLDELNSKKVQQHFDRKELGMQLLVAGQASEAAVELRDQLQKHCSVSKYVQYHITNGRIFYQK